MTGATVRVGVGTRFIYDGELAEVVDMATTQAGAEVVHHSGGMGVGVSVDPDDRVNEVCQHGHEPFSLRARADDPAPAWGHTPTAYL